MSEHFQKRFDEWCVVYDGPSAVPMKSKRHGSVFRGMRDFYEACTMARIYSEFLHQHGVKPATVFVVDGPTTTTSFRHEVVTACCGYSVAFRINVAELQPEAVAETN